MVQERERVDPTSKCKYCCHLALIKYFVELFVQLHSSLDVLYDTYFAF